jgi:hypothetical protein
MSNTSTAEVLNPGRPRKKLNALPPPIDSVFGYRIDAAVVVSGLSRATIYRLIKEQKLRSKLVAGRRLIEPAALRELFDAAPEQEMASREKPLWSRIERIAAQEGCTVEELAARPESELLRLADLGRKSVEKLKGLSPTPDVA